MKNTMLLVTLLMFLQGCASNNATVSQNLQTNDEIVQLAYVVGVNDKVNYGKKIKPGLSKIYVRVLETVPNDDKYVYESFHVLNFEAHEGIKYSLQTNKDDYQLNVWVIDEQQNKVSNTSSVNLSKIEYTPAKKVVESSIERIQIVSKQQTPFEVSRRDTSKCSVKSRVNKKRAGPSDAISSNKLPRRFYKGC
jgi:hypothetical protein